MTPLDTVRARLPWRVRTAEWIDPNLVIGGDDWSMTISCPWRVGTPAGPAYGSASSDPEDRVWDLIGAEVLAIEPQGTVGYADPRLLLSGGQTLELFNDADMEPYVIRSGDDIVIVGPFGAGSWA
jgi:hypothetical protein